MYANHTAGAVACPAGRSFRTYVHNRPVFVRPLPGSSTGTGVSSACNLSALMTCWRNASFKRFQQLACGADSIGKSGALQIHTFSRVDLRLTIQRQVVRVLRNENMGKQPRTCHAARDRSTRRFRLHDHIALSATHLRANMPNHLEAGRSPFQHFGNILTEHVQFGITCGTTLRGVGPWTTRSQPLFKVGSPSGGTGAGKLLQAVPETRGAIRIAALFCHFVDRKRVIHV